jgi:fimbrial chaperone protein
VKQLFRKFTLALSAFALTIFPLSQSVAMTVQPVVINLTSTGNGMTQIVTVENTFTNPLPVELRVDELVVDGDMLKPSGKDPGDLLIFPPQAIIQPGQTQSFRIQYVGDPALARSKHYYVTVAQLPVKLPEGQSAIQILYNFQVLISVSPNGAKPNLRVKSAAVATNAEGKNVPWITLDNDSPAHAYLSNGKLRMVAKNAAGKEVFKQTMSGPEIQQTIGFGLVGSGQDRTIQIPVELPADAVQVDAQFTPEN